MKKIFILLFFVLNVFCFAQNALAENFYIKNYDIVMNVDKYKNVHIKETIDAYFTYPSHGIFRTIPTNNGDSINSILVNNPKSISRLYYSTTIKIGNPEIEITGDKQYIISYIYHIKDKKNEFYFNIIGTEWNTNINKVNFKIIMPDKIEPSKTGLSIGQYGTRGFKDGAEYSVNDNIITGTTYRTLNPHECITIRAEVPEGYFEQSIFEKNKQIINIAVTLFLTLIAFMLWFVIGRDEHITPVVNFYPPKGLNSARVGVLDRENADIKDVVSLLFYLASKGYIKIITKGNDFSIVKLKEYEDSVPEEKELMTGLFLSHKTDIPDNIIFGENSLLSFFLDTNTKLKQNTDNVKNILSMALSLQEKGYIKINKKETGGFDIEKLKDYDGNIPEEKTIMANLFKNKITGKTTVTKNDLKYSPSFYMTVNNIISSLETSKKNMMTKNSTKSIYKFITWLCAVGITMSIYFNYFAQLFEFVIFAVIFIWMLPFCFYSFTSKGKNKIVNIVKISAIFLTVPFTFLLLKDIPFVPDWTTLLQAVCLVITVICSENLAKWSKPAVKLKGQIEGFKKFINVAEKHRIQQLSTENPNYACDMLSFAYALGISAQWMHIMESMFIAPPEWYQGNFNYHSFNRFSDNFHDVSVPSTVNGGVSTSSSSFSSSGGGGGFSGGGCGGGGGGSW